MALLAILLLYLAYTMAEKFWLWVRKVEASGSIPASGRSLSLPVDYCRQALVCNLIEARARIFLFADGSKCWS
jgi:hypothetical protein